MQEAPHTCKVCGRKTCRADSDQIEPPEYCNEPAQDPRSQCEDEPHLTIDELLSKPLPQTFEQLQRRRKSDLDSIMYAIEERNRQSAEDVQLVCSLGYRGFASECLIGHLLGIMSHLPDKETARRALQHRIADGADLSQEDAKQIELCIFQF